MIVDCDENMVDNGIETLQKAVLQKQLLATNMDHLVE